MNPNENYCSALYTQATLHVPFGSKEKYMASNHWNQYWNIEEYDVASINHIVNDTESIEFIYDLNGNIISQLRKSGIYIIKFANGTYKKVYINLNSL